MENKSINKMKFIQQNKSEGKNQWLFSDYQFLSRSSVEGSDEDEAHSMWLLSQGHETETQYWA